mgnify:CR=1 FL=1
MITVKDYKADFPLLMQDPTIYIDNAATTQRPGCVLDAEREFYEKHNANPLRGIYDLSVAATEAYESARDAVRDFIGARSSQEMIFTRNTTESINLVAYSYGLSAVHAGDEVVVSIMEHHSNLLPWQMVCRQTGAVLKFIECEKHIIYSCADYSENKSEQGDIPYIIFFHTTLFAGFINEKQS